MEDAPRWTFLTNHGHVLLCLGQVPLRYQPGEQWMYSLATDVCGALWPLMQKVGDADGIASMGAWLEIAKPCDLAGYLAAVTARDAILTRWLTFLQERPLVVLPVLCDLPPVQRLDVTRDGQLKVVATLRSSFVAPVLGLPGLAVPVGRHGRLRTGVQIMAARFREDLCLDAGEVVEAAEGTVRAVDPAA